MTGSCRESTGTTNSLKRISSKDSLVWFFSSAHWLSEPVIAVFKVTAHWRGKLLSFVAKNTIFNEIWHGILSFFLNLPIFFKCNFLLIPDHRENRILESIFKEEVSSFINIKFVIWLSKWESAQSTWHSWLQWACYKWHILEKKHTSMVAKWLLSKSKYWQVDRSLLYFESPSPCQQWFMGG